MKLETIKQVKLAMRRWGESLQTTNEEGDYIVDYDVAIEIDLAAKLVNKELEAERARLSKPKVAGRVKINLELSAAELKKRLNKTSLRSLAKELRVNRQTIRNRIKEYDKD